MHITIHEMESIFREIVSTSYPRSWDEDHVSFTLMEKLQTFFNNRHIHFPGWSKIVDWQSFKNRGKQETNFGDIAILVNIQFSDGGRLKGVACLEAKRSFPSKKFDSIDLPQVNRIYGNVPHSQLLLYTHYDPKVSLKFPDTLEWSSNMWVTSINTAKELLPQISTSNDKILRVSYPFSMFLMSRIFWGQDLDYREIIYNDIKNGIDRVDGFTPSFLAVVNVFYDGQNPVQTNLSDVWEKVD